MMMEKRIITLQKVEHIHSAFKNRSCNLPNLIGIFIVLFQIVEMGLRDPNLKRGRSPLQQLTLHRVQVDIQSASKEKS